MLQLTTSTWPLHGLHALPTCRPYYQVISTPFGLSSGRSQRLPFFLAIRSHFKDATRGWPFGFRKGREETIFLGWRGESKMKRRKESHYLGNREKRKSCREKGKGRLFLYKLEGLSCHLFIFSCNSPWPSKMSLTL